jgi:hypothetical protein
MVNQRQSELGHASVEAAVTADPRGAALHLSSNDLRSLKATVMVAMCLAA